MAIVNFISTQWADKLLENTANHYIGVAHCTRDYEGDIDKQGSVVKICGVGDINVSEYKKNQDMEAPQTLSDTVRNLKIDQVQYFNFQIDDVDLAQSNPRLMDGAMKNASVSLANAADSYVFSLYLDATIEVTDDAGTAENFVRHVGDLKMEMINNGIMDFDEIVVEVTPGVAGMLLRGNVLHDVDESELGLLGKLHGLKVYVSKNVCVDEDGYHKCLVRTKRSVAFAEKFITKCYTPENRFADAVKGLHLYGAKIIYPAEFMVLSVMPEEEY